MKRPKAWAPKNPWLKNRWMDERFLNVLSRRSLVSDTGIAYHGSRYGGGSGGRSPVSGERKVRTPQGRVLGNAQAEQSDMSATENIPPRTILGSVPG